MKILLDTDICIYTINRKNPKLLERLRSYSIGEVSISAVTYPNTPYPKATETSPN